MAFLEDPRLRQRWNQIAHDAETVTENAAAGIWSFQHNYINPCLGAVASSAEQCASVCLGSSDERRRRRRERERASAEYSFDFYDDWHDDEAGTSVGMLGGWAGEDWDRLLAGTGSQTRKHAHVTDQPRRKRAMSYGTRGGREDATIIPSTQPIGFLSKLPWRLGGTLRYRPSAADLQDNPGKHPDAETQPLLGADDGAESDERDEFEEEGVEEEGESDDDDDDDDDDDHHVRPRPRRRRSGTDGSGDTSDSFRSRGDIFPSDGEGDEDAIPLDDDVTYDMLRIDDRSSSAWTGSSKGKRPDVGRRLSGSRTVSRTTLRSADDDDGKRQDDVEAVAMTTVVSQSDGETAPPMPRQAGFQAAKLPRFG
ncbi:hypothetical protein XA68_18047 [Ophiocordyceps unilateralis]|uniref:Uncharacterized protein n=1 Tax=Ophiocordyceps unilateralis TaxID=268505 RepID=A0A2A9PIX0_OPHUN|nr:hypothetical protein XA68_18047 [Ophiocordyceps unilateralis]